MSKSIIETKELHTPGNSIEVASHPMYGVQVTIEVRSVEAFKQLVQRGLNTWDEAPPELKAFGDILIHGRVLQDYAGQDTSKRK